MIRCEECGEEVRASETEQHMYLHDPETDLWQEEVDDARGQVNVVTLHTPADVVQTRIMRRTELA